mgnify:CR=1 FL=1
MLHSDYLLSDETFDDDQWTEVVSAHLALWTDSTSYESAEFDVALHNMPTEQELLDMEENREAGVVDDFIIRKERRTALRH